MRVAEQKPGGDKRTAIFESTLALVREQGFHGTPMSQVAKKAGVAAGTLYLYFESKDHLIRVDDDVTCRSCGKRFEIPSHRGLVFLEELEGLPQDVEDEG